MVLKIKLKSAIWIKLSQPKKMYDKAGEIFNAYLGSIRTDKTESFGKSTRSNVHSTTLWEDTKHEKFLKTLW